MDPLIYMKLRHELGVQPVKFALKWLMSGFVGVLDIEQVLMLWDRVLGYDRMEILSAVAVCVVLFRREAILGAKSEREVEVSIF
jgi:hypothetical protein